MPLENYVVPVLGQRSGSRCESFCQTAQNVSDPVVTSE